MSALPEPPPDFVAGADDESGVATNPPVLAVRGLTVVRRDDPNARIVDRVDLEIGRGEALGLAGESGCGKTTTALSLLGLLPRGLRRSAGNITFNGRERTVHIDQLRPRAMRTVRWASISMIFQGAMNALDPVRSIGRQIGEAVALHEPGLGRREVRRRVAELLDQVGISASRASHFPHEFSGGQKQRVMIALALACKPELVIGDEPTTALDVITQAQVLDLLTELRHELGLALLLITHDLSVLADTCDRIAVMYAGEIVEHGPIESVYRRPEHPYTQRLLDLFATDGEPGRLPVPIPGSRPDPQAVPEGCRFHDRCHRAGDPCGKERPQLTVMGDRHAARCLFAPWPQPGASSVGQTR